MGTCGRTSQDSATEASGAALDGRAPAQAAGARDASAIDGDAPAIDGDAPELDADASSIDGDASAIDVEVVYAERDRQTLIAVRVPSGTTAAGAVERSGIRTRHPGIAADAPLGLHGRLVAGAHVLQAGDRVELYRPLPADPKDTRRRLAREGRTMAAGRPPGQPRPRR